MEALVLFNQQKSKMSYVYSNELGTRLHIDVLTIKISVVTVEKI